MTRTVPTTTTHITYNSAVTLPRYAQIVQVCECHLWGVHNPSSPCYDCDLLYTPQQRNLITRYLEEAQQEIEDVVEYPLSPRWFTERYRFNSSGKLILNRGKILDVGAMKTVSVFANKPLTVGTDTSTFILYGWPDGVNKEDIQVFHHNTNTMIVPSNVAYHATLDRAAFTLPRCRTVKPEVYQNTLPVNGVPYQNNDYFAERVSVKAVQCDKKNQVTLVWSEHSSNGCNISEETTEAKTQPAILTIEHAELGVVSVTPAKADDNGNLIATNKLDYGSYPTYVDVNYKAGMPDPTLQIEEVVVRLAHSKLPETFCAGCSSWSTFHRNATMLPTVFTRERLNCPFGLSNGAWTAWIFAQSCKLIRGYR